MSTACEQLFAVVQGLMHGYGSFFGAKWYELGIVIMRKNAGLGCGGFFAVG